MRRFSFLLLFLMALGVSETRGQATGQTPQQSIVNPLLILNQKQRDSLIKAAFNTVFANPDLINDAFAKYLDAMKGKQGVYQFMRDLNLKFKTFQTDQQPAALGFTYKYDNSWTKYHATKTMVVNQSYNLDFEGNVAFKKVDNPADFLTSKFAYNATWNWGGRTQKNNAADVAKLEALDDQIIPLTGNPANAAKITALLAQRAQYLHFTDQYFLGVNVNAAYESNQDFSKKQFAPGFLANLGAKSWNDQEALQYFNLPDYPFALLRLLTGTDIQFHLDGASFPSALLGLDYVVPEQDSLRKAVTGALDPFTRFRFELAFKTVAARIGTQVIYFSSDYRWYHQLGASAALKNAGIANFNYFVAELESSNGFFVHFTKGQLPFDKKSDNVYGIGFHYDLGNWK